MKLGEIYFRQAIVKNFARLFLLWPTYASYEGSMRSGSGGTIDSRYSRRHMLIIMDRNIIGLIALSAN